MARRVIVAPWLISAMLVGLIACNSDRAQERAREEARAEMREEALQAAIEATPLPSGMHALEPPPKSISLNAVLDAGLPIIDDPVSGECESPCRDHKSLSGYGIARERLVPMFRQAVTRMAAPVRSPQDKIDNHQAYIWVVDLGCAAVQSDTPTQQEFLRMLAADESPDVRLAVAARALYIDPEVALPVLRDIARRDVRDRALQAMIMLQDWENEICDIGL